MKKAKKSKKVLNLGSYRVSVDKIEPNTWNMNKVPKAVYDKLKVDIQETLDEAGTIPPIVCRRHPVKAGILQIVDGEHRWKIIKELGYAEIDVVVLELSDKRAMSMTAELNYLRGDPDMEKYPQYLARMVQENGVDSEWLSQHLPDSKDEIDSYLDSINFKIEEIKVPIDGEDAGMPASKDASNTDSLLEVKFQLRKGGAEMVERELARLCKLLGGGKNARGRALEVMAVLSSQTPDASITGFVEKDPPNGKSKKVDKSVSIDKKRKKKHKKKHQEERHA